MESQPKIERLGISRLDNFFSQHGWLFREQPLHDYGIDAQVEIVIDNKATGALIAIQVKSGKSYFSESTETAFIYRTDDKHIDYWIKHCLPVIVVLYDPDQDILYWEAISKDSIQCTGKCWKITIPKNKQLTEKSLPELCKLTQPPPYIQKLNKLRLDKYWIELVAQEESVYVEFEDWIHKSLPRINIRISCDSRDDVEEQSWPTIYGVGLSFEEILSYAIPWADFEVDEEAYKEFMESIWYSECYMGYDKEDGSEYFTEPFETWYEPPSEKIVPVSENGETQGYRLLLKLNEIGKSFVVLNNFLEHKDKWQERIFMLEF